MGRGDVVVHLVTPRLRGGELVECVGQVTMHRVGQPPVEGDFYTSAWQTDLRLEEYAHW